MSAPQVLVIEGEFNIYRAMELKTVLLATPQPLEINLAGVTEIDTAGIQLLMLAKKAALGAGAELRLLEHSPAVMEVFELLNLGAFFDDLLIMSKGTEKK